jgi:4-amino-4-deoxy-L-arabinose transferase-like glycosyltransferase
VSFLASFVSTPERRLAAAILALTAVRIFALVVGHPELGPDEGQYWFWSKDLAFGYFSKPPVVAWSIAATTALFGDAEWAVRLSAPLYHAGSATFIFLLTRRLSSPAVAFWAGIAWLTLPGVFLSAALITTDAPLIFFWCAALYLFFRLADAGRGGKLWLAGLFGAAIGLGMLSKYAMTYFLIGLALAIAASPARRRSIGLAPALVAAAVAVLVFAPNIAWNAANDFQTLSHTAANADWNGDFGHPDRLLKFLLDQFGVAGPILLVLIVIAAFDTRGKGRDDWRILLAFAIPAIAVVSAQAFLSRAHGNWAAVSYPSAIILATLWASERPRAFLASKLSVGLHAALGAGFLLAFVSWPFAEAVGAAPAFKQLRGWRAQGAAIAEASAAYDAVMTDDREITGELAYYARGAKAIVAWNSNRSIDSHFEAFNAFDPAVQRRVLYVSENADALYIQNQFATIVPLGEVAADIGRGRTRTLYLFDVSGKTGVNP